MLHFRLRKHGTEDIWKAWTVCEKHLKFHGTPTQDCPRSELTGAFPSREDALRWAAAVAAGTPYEAKED